MKHGFRPLARVESRKGLFMLLVLYSAFYGLLIINWLDLFAGGIPGYHLLLTILYFTPFITAIVLWGLRDWEVALSLGLFTSLMNDLFYYVVGNALFGVGFDLVEWYRCQLIPVCRKDIAFDFLFFKVKPYPYLMPLSIYLRAVAVALLLWKWWSEEQPHRWGSI